MFSGARRGCYTGVVAAEMNVVDVSIINAYKAPNAGRSQTVIETTNRYNILCIVVKHEKLIQIDLFFVAHPTLLCLHTIADKKTYLKS